MSALDDWAVTLILLVICGVVILLIALSCKLFSTWKFAAFFGGFDDDEKAGLTRKNPCNGYTFTPQVPVGADGFHHQPPYQQFNEATPPVDKGYDNQALTFSSENENAHKSNTKPEEPPAPWIPPQPVAQQHPLEVPEADAHHDNSPMSVDSISVDYDPPEGLQRAGSCESVASDSSVMQLEPEAPKIGQLEFGLEYDSEVSELVVSVIQARDLETEKLTNQVDSYVKCWVHPRAKGQKKQTKVIKETPNPVYKERFLFSIDALEVLTRTVRFQVCSCDKYARHKLLGETELKLCDIDIRQPIRVWMNLRDMDEKAAEFGDIMFSLSYLPTAERLTIVIVKARNLKWNDGRESGNCFVKVYLLQNGKRVGKKKTSTKKDERNPIFNEAMIFSVPSSSLSNVQLRISMLEQEVGGKPRSIGHNIVGANLSGTQGTHWNQMMSSLRKPVAMWHSLRK
ncbi:synaptotagmin 12 [Capitella teleta]|uniref:Synaptotagmin 12 n=1 Tax=Capitella teleta TaxID=283909 RepID=R7U5Z4_CAPTE|nr:synaptotagmin 12 [Capitella teleta]|eukprot:ELT99116.1 synaptotagmin 12 [Capitella teleta]